MSAPSDGSAGEPSGHPPGTGDGVAAAPHATGERAAAELAARSRVIVRRSIGSPILFTIVYSSLASAIYFSLGVIAGHALGLTPVVFLVAALLFTLTAMTYVEGASLHQDRGGSTVFARYAFNELVSFIAGWAILLDYMILIAVTAYSATQYLRTSGARWATATRRSGSRWRSSRWSCCRNIRGFGGRRARRVGILVAGDLALQGFIVVLGLVLFFNPHTLVDPIHLGTAPTWSDLVFALTVAVVAFTSLESASGLAGEVRISRRGLKRMVASGTATVVFLYVGIALVAVTALPVEHGQTELATRYINAPMIGVVSTRDAALAGRNAQYLVAGLATVTLVAAANSAMLGLSRLAYSLSTNRQIPSGARAAAPGALDAVRADHPRRPDRGGPGRAGGPRLPDRHLRVRRDARVHDRAPVDLPAALHRARPRPALPGAAVGQLPRRAPAAAGRVRRARLGGRLGCGDDRARTGALRRALAGCWPGWCCT